MSRTQDRRESAECQDRSRPKSDAPAPRDRSPHIFWDMWRARPPAAKPSARAPVHFIERIAKGIYTSPSGRCANDYIICILYTAGARGVGARRWRRCSVACQSRWAKGELSRRRARTEITDYAVCCEIDACVLYEYSYVLS
jgi:hypothetical protein